MTFAINAITPSSLRNQRERGALLTGVMWLLCIVSLGTALAVIISAQPIEIAGIVRFDALAAVMTVLITFVSAIVHSFARRYMDGDSRFGLFFNKLSGVTLLALLTVCADHVILLASAWLGTGLVLASLMGHVNTWTEARHAASLARNSFIGGSLCLAAGLALLVNATGQWTISDILNQLTIVDALNANHFLAALLLIVAAMIQSAQWPFQRWLIGSMNSPTPVSALMHAGIVNAGGFLLARFASLFTASAELMLIIFAVGAITALLGTAWMLVQTDIKRSLGCSTMGQMGFMVMQCGLGLFTAAIAHLVLHGLFKAALFLGAGSAIHDASATLAQSTPQPTKPADRWALLVGVGIPAMAAAAVFAQFTGKTLIPADANTVLVAFALLAALQGALAMNRGDAQLSVSRLIGSTAVLATSAALYAGGFMLVHSALSALPMLHTPQSWNLFDAVVVTVFVAGWLAFTLRLHTAEGDHSQTAQKLYVRLLNDSQPSAGGITAVKSHYRPF
ncbi:MAG: oxidoreductase [Candidatus Competibacteraceae bacterium]|nr:oxidoreductase [Candidatus Competibacteraceae bacterium]